MKKYYITPSLDVTTIAINAILSISDDEDIENGGSNKGEDNPHEAETKTFGIGFDFDF